MNHIKMESDSSQIGIHRNGENSKINLNYMHSVKCEKTKDTWKERSAARISKSFMDISINSGFDL